MPVEFLSDREVAAYGRYVGVPSPAELDRFFFLDDADKVLIGRRRGAHRRLGFALQLTRGVGNNGATSTARAFCLLNGSGSSGIGDQLTGGSLAAGMVSVGGTGCRCSRAAE